MPPRRLPSPRTLLNTALAVAAVIAFAVLVARSDSSPGIEVQRRDPPGALDLVRVEIRGAVARPGVVTAAPGDRVADALTLAGGALPEADLGALNLARRIIDGEQIRVPTQGELTAMLLDLNEASASDLEALPGIGSARARAIIAARPYASSDDLVERDVLPADVYEAIRDRVTTGSTTP
ncbi:MAG: helix-hairpin-helix domain-containing protein [Dehalococcoidia bacterium]|nr:helix-hairpin-helix domain-containing protein [Dehalococcoidia bacterium]